MQHLVSQVQVGMTPLLMSLTIRSSRGDPDPSRQRAPEDRYAGEGKLIN